MMPKSGGKETKRSLAETTSKFVCYERAVQAPDVDAGFIKRTYKKLRGKDPKILREDFCGTAKLCSEWVKLSKDNQAYGIDLDRKTLEWGIENHIVPLDDLAAGITLIQRDVMDPVDFKADAIAAFNFSYCTFKDRDQLRAYFKAAYKGLKKDGVLYLDIFGGPESMDLREERTEYENFTYVWDQAAFNPITHEITCHIHFEFKDGSKKMRAFTYRWRLWQIPEIRDIAREAGFKDCQIFWEGTDHKSGEGNGVFKPSKKGDNAPAFVSYIMCAK
jgi:SAM-dependent methyltransferase